MHLFYRNVQNCAQIPSAQNVTNFQNAPYIVSIIALAQEEILHRKLKSKFNQNQSFAHL